MGGCGRLAALPVLLLPAAVRAGQIASMVPLPLTTLPAAEEPGTYIGRGPPSTMDVLGGRGRMPQVS